jgi:HEPN domain-containing protein
VQLNIDSVVQYWLATAADDLRAAEHLFEAGDYTHALFFGHLYLEKLIKARIVQYAEQHAPLSHNLRYLAEKGGLNLTPEQEAFLVRVTEYNTRTRYPDLEMDFKRQCTRGFCDSELRQIKEFGKWLEEIVRS